MVICVEMIWGLASEDEVNNQQQTVHVTFRACRTLTSTCLLLLLHVHCPVCVWQNFSRTDRLLRHRRLCQGRSVAKVESQPCCEPRPYPQEPPPAPPTWSPLHPPPGRLAVWHSSFPTSPAGRDGTSHRVSCCQLCAGCCHTSTGWSLQLQSWD